MIAEVILRLDLEIAAWLARQPLTFAQWIQKRRLQRAVRLLRLYAVDEQPDDDIDTEGDPR